MNLPDDFVKHLRRSKEGQALIKGIREEMLKLDLISNMKTNFADDRAIAIETLGRKRAKEVLQEILKPFVEFREGAEGAEEKEIY